MTSLGKCCMCLDEAVTANHGEIDTDTLADAIVLAPYLMSTGANIMAVPLPMCLKHRSAQIRGSGAGRLIVS